MFIAFEGPDGSGKSTQIKLLAEYLQGLGQNVLLTREPGGTAIGEQIRHVLHDLRNKAMQPRAEILLYSAARAQLVGEKIKPHLAAGDIVLSDRYADSTMAYQGYGRGLDLETLRLITAFATDHLKPDCGGGRRAGPSGTAWTISHWRFTSACGRAIWNWRAPSRSAGWCWTQHRMWRRCRRRCGGWW